MLVQVDRAKVLSNTIKQKRKEKAGKWEVPLPKVRVKNINTWSCVKDPVDAYALHKVWAADMNTIMCCCIGATSGRG